LILSTPALVHLRGHLSRCARRDTGRGAPWWPAAYPVSISQARRLSPDAFRVDDATLSWDVHGRCGFAGCSGD